LQENTEIKNILSNVKETSGMDFIPGTLSSLALVSPDILKEHLKEQSELMSPYKVDKKTYS